jgi:hypothetical protein
MFPNKGKLLSWRNPNRIRITNLAGLLGRLAVHIGFATLGVPYLTIFAGKKEA